MRKGGALFFLATMHETPIIRPAGLWSEFTNRVPILEYCSRSLMPGLRDFFCYLCLVERCEDDPPTGAGAAVLSGYGLVQTRSITAAEIATLKEKLEAIHVPARVPAMLALDGDEGCIRICDAGSKVELKWCGVPPDEWGPLLGIVGSLQEMIRDRMWDDTINDSFEEGANAAKGTPDDVTGIAKNFPAKNPS